MGFALRVRCMLIDSARAQALCRVCVLAGHVQGLRRRRLATYLPVHDAAEEHGALEVRGERKASAGARGHALALEALPAERGQRQRPQVRVGGAPFRVELVLSHRLGVAAVQQQRVGVHGEPRRRARRGSVARAARLADGGPRERLRVEDVGVAVVLHFLAVVEEAAEDDEAALVHHRAVTRARRGRAAQLELLPPVGRQVEPPQALEVVEALLVWRRELAAEDVHEALPVARDVRGARGRAAGAVHAAPHSLLNVVAVQVTIDAALLAVVVLAAEEHQLMALGRDLARGERSIAARAGRGDVRVDGHRALLGVLQCKRSKDGIDVVLAALRLALLAALLLVRRLLRLALRLLLAGNLLCHLLGVRALRRLLLLVAPGTHRGRRGDTPPRAQRAARHAARARALWRTVPAPHRGRKRACARAQKRVRMRCSHTRERKRPGDTRR